MNPPYVTNVRCVMIDFVSRERVSRDGVMLAAVPRVGEWVSFDGRAFEVLSVWHVAVRGSMRVNDSAVYLLVGEQAGFPEIAELS